MQLTPLIAAGWIEIVVSVVVFAFYVLSQLSSAMNNRPAKPQAPKPRGRVAPPQQPRTLEDKLRTEVEEFLRQVQGEQAGPGGPPPQPSSTPTTRTREAQAESPVETAFELEPARGASREHADKHVVASALLSREAMLGAEIGRADEKLEVHVPGNFHHQVGSLEHHEAQVVPTGGRQNTAAAEIAQLLRSPRGIRQVIVASEILRRPEI